MADWINNFKWARDIGTQPQSTPQEPVTYLDEAKMAVAA